MRMYEGTLKANSGHFSGLPLRCNSGTSLSNAMSKKKSSKLPEELEQIRTRVSVTAAAPTHVVGMHDAHTFSSMGLDNTLDVKAWKKQCKMVLLSHRNQDDIEFDLTGVDAPLANALRRIMIAEIPTMAIERVNIYDNTSIIQDEVLAHRLGLLPVYADPDDFTFMWESEGESTPANTIALALDVQCRARPGAPETAMPVDRFINSNVYTKDLRWVPLGDQNERFADAPIRMAHDDILVAKLRPGQRVEIEMFCEKGIARTHAKWSAVATASYRLMPEIEVDKTKVKDAIADELVAKCPMKVFDIEDLGNGHRTAVAARPRACTMCRECIREPAWDERVKLRRVRDHFIFSVESVGVLAPKRIVKKSIEILKNKCDYLLKALDTITSEMQE